MSPDAPMVVLSPLDRERFGIETAKASHVSLETLPAVIDFCRAHDVILLISRCLTSELQAAQAMERQGFGLMDTLVYYARSLSKTPVPTDSGQAALRPVRPGEEGTVQAVAANAFQGYMGHYHADPRLDRTQCDRVYTDWAYRSCISREVADEVLVAEVEGAIAGFATLRLNGPEESEGVLFGVASWAQSRGIYRSLMIRGMEWSVAQGATRMVVSTQITNIAVQKVWTRLGFEPSRSYYTFHKWFS